ncbi:MAG TPA: hypothetical protein VK923_13230 [Euzebyales bacterium]|nr:hypothetical protein [Euzebyales bacterium]
MLRAIESSDGIGTLQAGGFRDSTRETTPELIDAEGLRPDLATDAPEPVVPDIVVGPLMQAWQDLSQTGNLLAVVDVSGSMKTEVPGTGASRLDLSKQGLEAGIALTDPASSGGLWEFSTELDGSTDHRVLVPLGPLNEEVREGVTRQEAEIATVRELQARADTGLHDTILAGYEHMLDNFEPGKLNAVIFFTDGKNDDADGVSLGQLRRRLRDLVDPQRPVLFIGVAYGAEADFEVLNRVTNITGGKLYKLDQPEDIRDVFIDVQTAASRSDEVWLRPYSRPSRRRSSTGQCGRSRCTRDASTSRSIAVVRASPNAWWARIGVTPKRRAVAVSDRPRGMRPSRWSSRRTSAIVSMSPAWSTSSRPSRARSIHAPWATTTRPPTASRSCEATWSRGAPSSSWCGSRPWTGREARGRRPSCATSRYPASARRTLPPWMATHPTDRGSASRGAAVVVSKSTATSSASRQSRSSLRRKNHTARADPRAHAG